MKDHRITYVGAGPAARLHAVRRGPPHSRGCVPMSWRAPLPKPAVCPHRILMQAHRMQHDSLLLRSSPVTYTWLTCTVWRSTPPAAHRPGLLRPITHARPVSGGAAGPRTGQRVSWLPIRCAQQTYNPRASDGGSACQRTQVRVGDGSTLACLRQACLCHRLPFVWWRVHQPNASPPGRPGSGQPLQLPAGRPPARASGLERGARPARPAAQM